MNPRYDRLNECLQHALQRRDVLARGEEPASPAMSEQEIGDLVTLAQNLQSSSYLHANPDFARRLERQLLVHHAARRRQRSLKTGRQPRMAPSPRRMSRATITVGLVLLLVLAASLLVTAAQASNPVNPLFSPLYHLIHLPSQQSGESAAQTRAAQNIQRAQGQLDALAAMTGPGQHEVAYQHTLTALEQDIQAANSAVSALPASTQRDRLQHLLSDLTLKARQMLRTLLPQLTLSERQLTTVVLGVLGESVPVLQVAVIEVAPPPVGTATITLKGSDLEPGAILLLDGREVTGSGALQQGGEVFVVNWTGNLHPHSVGVINPDGTVAQTTTIQMKSTTGTNHDKGNSRSSNGGNGNGKMPGN